MVSSRNLLIFPKHWSLLGRYSSDFLLGPARDLWREFAGELGMAGAAIPEDLGGMGLGMSELALIAAEIGKRLCPVPHQTTVGLAAQILIDTCAGPERDAWLCGIAAGELTVAVALPTGAFVAGGEVAGGESVALSNIESRPDGDRLVVTGSASLVEGAEEADLILLPVRFDGEVKVLALPREKGWCCIQGRRWMPRDLRQISPSRPHRLKWSAARRRALA